MRDFGKVRTLEDATEALVGARVVRLQRRETLFILTMESVAGERFDVAFGTGGVSIQMGPQKIELKPEVLMTFRSEREG